MEKPENNDERASLVGVITGSVRSLGAPIVFGLIAAFSGAATFVHFTSEIFEGETMAFDASVRHFAQQLATPYLTSLMIALSFIGSPAALTVIGISTAIFFLYVRWKREFVLFALTMAGEIAINFVLKTGFQRPRPEPFFAYALPDSYSFPSGHALGSFCFFGILAWLITARIENRAVILSLRLLASLLVISIGFSRIYLGVHYPSDVLAGFLAAFIWLLSIMLADAALRRRPRSPGKKISLPIYR